MNPGCSNPEHSSGFSLIELMLALLIGLIIMAGVMQMFITTRDAQRSSEDQLVLVADARFAINTIAYDLRHTGFWGRHNDYLLIACQRDPASFTCPAGAKMPLATGDCADDEYINLGAPLFATNDVNPYPGTCANQSYKAGTDVLSLRYADSNRIGTNVLANDVAYIRTSASVGMLFIGDTFPAAPDYDYDLNDASTRYSNHLLVSRIYYVSDYTDEVGDGRPSLRRGDLVAGPAMDSDVLLPNVEDFQLEFGVDLGSNGVAGKKDGQVDSYVNSDKVTNWSNGEVLSVRISVLIRAKRPDRDCVGSGGTQTFTYAGKTATYDDCYHRRLISSVVKLRNTFQVNLKEAGS